MNIQTRGVICCAASILAVLTLLTGQSRASVPKKTTVALTVTLPLDADAECRELAASLLTLLELRVSQDGRVSVVERQQLDSVLHELALSVDLSKVSEKKLRLGKLVNADLLLTMELLPRQIDDEPQNVRVRIVESLTGVIRGSVVTPVEPATIDESAVHIAEYLSLIAARPTEDVVTVAVAPFESLGRFDRLKALETGLRDMVTSRLRRWSDLGLTEKMDTGSSRVTKSGTSFLVLQRSNMKQLLRELDLVQSGLTDASRLPEALPTRAAAYLIQGTIDEQNRNGFEIIVSAEIVHASSGESVREFRFVSRPDQLPEKLAAQVDLIAGFLRQTDGSGGPHVSGALGETKEAELLFSQVVRDLRRFGRLTPADFSSRRFELPKTVSYRFARGGVTRVDTPQHRHTLKKSIDRLESTLFIMPDRADVSYSLAFCYSYHVDGIMNLQRADELLRRVITSDPDGPLGVAALRLLSELCFHHHRGKCAPGYQKMAATQLLFAFRSMPDQAKNGGWADIPDLIRDVYPRNDPQGLSIVMKDIVQATENAPSNLQYKLAMNSLRFATVDQLKEWVEGDNSTLKQVACRGLGQRASGRKNYQEAADWYLVAANALLADERKKHSSLVDNFRIQAARALINGDQIPDALTLLESFRPNEDSSVNLGYWAQSIGDCYEQLGRPDKAIRIYVEVAGLDEGYVNNTDLVERINRLGGVPLSKDREINVRYVKNPPGGTSNSLALATDGHVVFSAGNFAGFATGKPGRGILSYNPVNESWADLSPEGLGRVTCMDYSEGTLWVGTHENGLWQGDVRGNHWKQITQADGLPGMTISAVAADRTGAYVGVGTDRGGLVRLERDGSIDVMEGDGSPVKAPIDIVVYEDSLFVSSGTVIREMNRKTRQWKPLGRASYCRVFRTESGLWGTFDSHQLFRIDELKAALQGERERPGKRTERNLEVFIPSLRSLAFENGQFKDSWYPRGESRASYHVRFAVEWEDDVWFGGSPYSRFQSAGLYRCRMKDGRFTAFSPHDGFRTSTTYMTYDAVPLGDELYVSTSAGLVAVTRREKNSGEESREGN